MKVFGYVMDDSGDVPSRLEEVSFAASPEELLRISAFFRSAAQKMAEAGASFGHEHASDFCDEWDSDCDIIIARQDPELGDERPGNSQDDDLGD